jgi:uncharacterized protein (DUF2249 family)
MSNAVPNALPATVDTRTIAPLQRHAQVLTTFRALRAGESMDLLADHDPTPLRYRFETELPGAARWDAVDAGPQLWRARITRLATVERSCCGACGGA